MLLSADFRGNDVSILTIDAATGTLTPITGSPVSVVDDSVQLAINALYCSTVLSKR